MESSLNNFPNEQILNYRQTMPEPMPRDGCPQECDSSATFTAQDVTIL